MSKIVAVFGSARVMPDDGVYELSYQVGQALASDGYITMTGGFAGVMEATSKGAAESGGHVQGITVESLGLIGESYVNQWVSEEIGYPNLRTRIDHLIDTGDAYVVMPGGIGTVQEFVEVWQLMRLGDIPKKPILVYKPFWHSFVQQMLDSAYVNQSDVDYLTLFDAPAEMSAALEAWFKDQEETQA